MEETKSTAPPLVSFSRHSQTYCVYVTVSLTPPSTVKPGCSTALDTTTIVISWSSSSSCGWVPVMSSTVAGRGCLCYWTYSLWVKWISSDSRKYHNISAVHSCTGILEQSDWYIWDGKSSFFHHCLLCIPVCAHVAVPAYMYLALPYMYMYLALLYMYMYLALLYMYTYLALPYMYTRRYLMCRTSLELYTIIWICKEGCVNCVGICAAWSNHSSLA